MTKQTALLILGFLGERSLSCPYICVVGAAICLSAVIVLISRPLWRLFRRLAGSWRAHRTWGRAKKQRGEAATDGSPVCWLEIPKAGIATPVLKGVSPGNLHQYPCGEMQGGNGNPRPPVIFGHREKHFRGLRRLRVGDQLTLENRHGARVLCRVRDLEVVAKRQLPSRLESRNGEGALVLVTCYPFRYAGPAPGRFLVWAYPVALLHRSPSSDEANWLSCLLSGKRGMS